MAESMVSFAIDKLATFLIAESNSLGSLSKDVKDLSLELESIKAVLKSAEKKAEEDGSVDVWLMQVRDVAYKIEDVIDEYILLKQQQRHLLQAQHHFFLMITKIRKFLCKAVTCVSQFKPKYELTSEIKDIKADIEAINNRRQRYQFSTTTEDSQHHYRIPTHSKDDSELFGLEDRKESLIQLMNLEEQGRLMIAAVGMGGLGKTTLVRKVFEKIVEKKCFDAKAWVTVSQSYKICDVLMTILKQVNNESSSSRIDASNKDEVISTLRSHLKSISYIIVFDDVWDIELLQWVDVALPSNEEGSRILMTTRDKTIAEEWKASLGGGHVHDLQPLLEKEAWDLFVRKIFGKKNCPRDLKEPGRDIVGKCKGLPLAIIAVAGLLSTKQKILSEWNKLRNSINTELEGNRRFESTKRILQLSYHELPYHLKPCYLYLSVFPEDYSIQGEKLIRLWIAEGFIQHQEGKTLEEVAEDYLVELVNRSLVEIDRDYILFGVPAVSTTTEQLYKIHDILREMIIIPKSKKLGFSIHLTKESNLDSTKMSFRRFGMGHDFANQSDINDLSSSSTRSLLSFQNQQINLKELLRDAKLLKVLDLEDVDIENAALEELGNLQHLQYLSLRSSDIKVLPKWVGKLWNLKTLDLMGTRISEIPKEVAHCCKLRHLLGYSLKIEDGVLENLNELQQLEAIEAYKESMDGLWYLKYLRSLWIRELEKEHGRQLCYTIEKMKHLRSLFIQSDDIIDVQHITTPPLLLERLVLKGSLEKLPDWIAKLNNLVVLVLHYSRLEEDSLTILQGLPNLTTLNLIAAFVGEKLDFGDSGFSKLVQLTLFDNIH